MSANEIWQFTKKISRGRIKNIYVDRPHLLNVEFIQCAARVLYLCVYIPENKQKERKYN